MVRDLKFTVEDLTRGFTFKPSAKYSLLVRIDGNISYVLEKVSWEKIEQKLSAICKDTKAILDKQIRRNNIYLVLEVIKFDKKTDEKILNNITIELIQL